VLGLSPSEGEGIGHSGRTKFGTRNCTNHSSYSVCASTEIESTENRVLFQRTNFVFRLVLL
jgi:hypothetical protein